MKTLKITLGIIATLVVILLVINAVTVRSIKTEIIIDAPVERVWQVLMNHKEYANWNPFIVKISGSTVPGNNLDVILQSEGNKPMNFKPLVLENIENEEFRWIGSLGVKGVFDGEHYFILESTNPNQTRFIQGENFTGILSGVLMKTIEEDTKKGFISMNKALKHLAEEL